jgi:hypothetical protein
MLVTPRENHLHILNTATVSHYMLLVNAQEECLRLKQPKPAVKVLGGAFFSSPAHTKSGVSAREPVTRLSLVPRPWVHSDVSLNKHVSGLGGLAFVL